MRRTGISQGREGGGRGRRVAALIALAAAWAIAPVTSAGVTASLDLTLTDGSASVIVPPGGTFNVKVAVNGPRGTSFNAALFRLIFTVEGCEVITYNWHPPFVTGGATDFSLEGLSLPATVNDATLEGPGYPISTADVEFGNFDFFLGSTGGTLVDLILRAPVAAVPGESFVVLAFPDAFSDGFEPLEVEPGLLLTVEIANSGVLGDLSGDSIVNSIDLAILLGNWGGTGIGDINGDDLIDAVDLAIMLGAWTG
jgi:hypothetical protein